MGLELQVVVNCLMGGGYKLRSSKRAVYVPITWVISLACLRVFLNVCFFINLMFYSLSHCLPIKIAFNFHVFVSFIVFLLSLIFSLYCSGKENHLTLCKSLKICLRFLHDLIIFFYHVHWKRMWMFCVFILFGRICSSSPLSLIDFWSSVQLGYSHLLLLLHCVLHPSVMYLFYIFRCSMLGR